MKKNTFLFGILLICLSQNAFSQKTRTMEEQLRDIEDADNAIKEYDDEITQWIVKAELLTRKIDVIIAQWHKEKSRDLEKEAIQGAIVDIEKAITREKQLGDKTGKNVPYLTKLKSRKKELENKL